jgi:hypothetical protein
MELDVQLRQQEQEWIEHDWQKEEPLGESVVREFSKITAKLAMIPKELRLLEDRAAIVQAEAKAVLTRERAKLNELHFRCSTPKVYAYAEQLASGLVGDLHDEDKLKLMLPRARELLIGRGELPPHPNPPHVPDDPIRELTGLVQLQSELERSLK